jgi:hypothetical protein
MALMRTVHDSLLPQGLPFHPAKDGNMDKLDNARADNAQLVYDDLEKLAYIRNPYKISYELLPDLEREFGIATKTSLTEAKRREILAGVVYRKSKLSTVKKLQDALDITGFGAGGYGLIVTPNNKITDPASIVSSVFQTTAHEFGAEGIKQCAGNISAFCSIQSGYFLGNGDRQVSEPSYLCAGTGICCRVFDGSDSKSGTECAGYYTEYSQNESEYSQNESEYSVPTSDYWGLIFFVGGEAGYFTTPEKLGQIEYIKPVDIPSYLRGELHRIILRIKPLGIWAGMIIRYI